MTASLNHYANGWGGRGASVRAGAWETSLLGSDPTPNNISHCDLGQVAELHCTLVLFLHLQAQANNSYLRGRDGTKMNELMSRTCCGEKAACRNVIISTNLWFAQGLPQQLSWMRCSFSPSSLIMSPCIHFCSCEIWMLLSGKGWALPWPPSLDARGSDKETEPESQNDGNWRKIWEMKEP